MSENSEPGQQTDTVVPLGGSIRNYAWGSRTALAELTGRPVPTDHPEAEMWFGAHPAAPSRIIGSDRNLLDLISTDPAGQLGPDRRSDRLSFLLKVLAADHALSLQAHPTKQQAEDGYARENTAGIALTASDRSYRDDNHKPELLVALTRFEALAGFRPVPRTRELLAVLEIPELARTTALLGGGSDVDDLRALVTTWITLPSATKAELVDLVAQRCRDLLVAESASSSGASWSAWMHGPVSVALELAEEYPGDSGVLISLLLNHVILGPGQAIYLGAGQLHAYVRGTGVEIMANSDNVLRGGLTTKHVDVPELMRVVDFAPVADPLCPKGPGGRFDVPVPDFALREIDAGELASVAGPAVVLATSGGAELSGGAGEPTSPVMLRPGDAVWVPAAAGTVSVTSLGRVFLATVS